MSVYILVEREREIRKFVPVEFWRIRADFLEFESELKKIFDKPVKIDNKKLALEIEGSLKNSDFLVS